MYSETEHERIIGVKIVHNILLSLVDWILVRETMNSIYINYVHIDGMEHTSALHLQRD